MTAERIDPEHEAQLLRQLKALGENHQVRRVQIVEELLHPYFDFSRRIFAYRLSRFTLDESDLDDLAHRLLKRLADTIEHGNLAKPLTNAALDNIDWEIMDFYDRVSKTAGERLEDPETVAGARELVPPPPTSLEEAEAFKARIAELDEREQRILTERFYVGKPPEEIGKALGMTRGNVDTVSSRALKKLRSSDLMADVRKRLGGTER